MSSRHPGIEVIAALAEGRLPIEDAEHARRHLAGCRACASAYADAVRYRAAWLARPEAFAPDRAVLRTAVAAGAARPRPALPLAGGAATLALAAGVAIVAIGGYALWRGARPARVPDLPPATRMVTERASAQGLVMPGGAHAADQQWPGLRSGQAVSPPGIDDELRRTIAAYEAGARDAGTGTVLLATLLAAGELTTARDYAREVLERHPRHVPALTLAAGIDYRLDDLPAALSLLDRAARVAPRDPAVMLNRALVLRSLGREEAARELLQRVRRAPEPALAARAARELGAPAAPRRRRRPRRVSPGGRPRRPRGLPATS